MNKGYDFSGRSTIVFLVLLLIGFLISSNADGATDHPNPIEASRPILQKSSQSLKSTQTMQATPAGYCSSVGGSTSYENISKVQVNRVGTDVLQIVVDVHIANPTGCTAGNPCPEYDGSPEYVNVWIDWNGDNIFESNEKVLDAAMSGYLNINYNGTMTTTAQVTIPNGAKSSTYLRSNLGWGHDPNDPCEYSWTWGNVVDKPVEIITAKVIQLDALNDIQIMNITDPVWQKIFDLNGNLIDVSPIQNDPIADDMTSGSLKIKATLGVHPSQPSWTPRVSYQWFIQGYSGLSGNGQFTGWDGTFSVSTPQMVDQYTLNLVFTISDDNGNIITQNQSMNIKLYVVYDTPLLSLPKEKWVDKATTWARFAVGPWTAVQFLNNDIYTNSGWLYRDGGTTWSALVEGTAGQGNCVSFSNVWDNLSKVLGVAGTSVQRECGMHTPCNLVGIKGFITKPSTSLPPESITGNAHQQSGSFDRWLFGMHQVGKIGSISYYDPTFGKSYSNIYDFIEWHATGNSGSDSFGNYLELTSGHKAYERSAPTPVYPWGEWEYHSPSTNMPAPAGSGAVFTGNYTTYGVDSDGTGFYNALKIEADINIIKPGTYSISGILRWGTKNITMRASDVSTIFSSAAIQATQAGLKSISLSFSGEDIYRSGLDGIYTIELTIYDSNGQPIASTPFDTLHFRHLEFKEIPISIDNVADRGEDDDNNGLFNFLSVDVVVSIIKPGKYNITGYLESGNTIIAGAGASSILNLGQNTILLKFDGKKIRKSGIDGPYHLHISLSDDIISVDKDVNTNNYSHKQFEQGTMNISNSFSDYGTDTDSDGYYNFLNVEIVAEIIHSGNYKLTGWLNDANGAFITFAQTQIVLSAGSKMVLLKFDGTKIYDHGVDGPFVLNYVVAYDVNESPVDSTTRDIYSTSTYSHAAFQRPSSPLVSLTGKYNDMGIDTDGDGKFNILKLQAEVMTSAAGNVIANGRLVDRSGNEIQWSSGFAHVEANIPQMVTIDFDGRLIYANMQDGPYYLKNLNVYHTGEPSQNVYKDDAHTTKSYAYSDFDVAEVIRGSVTDKGNPISEALVSIAGTNFDYSDINGNYHVAVMNPGTYQVTIDASGYTTWKIFVDGKYKGQGTSIAVTVVKDGVTQVDFKQQIPSDLDNDGDVDNNDLKILNSYLNKPASACAACDLNGDGMITVLDSRKLVLMCTRLRCATQ